MQINSTLTRRQMLISGVLATAASLTRAAETPPALTLGFSTYGLKSLTTEQAFKTIAEIGFDSVELAALAGWDADGLTLTADRKTAFRRQLADSKLKLTAIMENTPATVDDKKTAKDLDRLKAAVALAHELSPDRSAVVETVVGGKEWEKHKPILLKRLPEWVKIADAAGVTICIKPHRMSAMSTPQQAIEVFKALGSPSRLRMVYDYSHFAMRDPVMPMDQTIQDSLSWTPFVAVKDVAIINGKEAFKLPGETGTIDYPAMLRQLVSGGYRGDVNCEVSAGISTKPGYDGIAAAKTCYANMATAFKTAGVNRGA